jgi:hypothetical protein
MTFKLTPEQTETIQAVFDKQSPGNGDYDCWEGINKQLQSTDERRIKINEEGKEEFTIFYREIITPNMTRLHIMKVYVDMQERLRLFANCGYL